MAVKIDQVGISRGRKAMFGALKRKIELRKYENIRKKQFQCDAILTEDTNKILICGDSHVEGLKLLSSLNDFVHGGIGGADAIAYAKTIGSIHFPTRYLQSILIIGTNDIGKSDAISEKNLEEFSKNVIRIVDSMRLGSHSIKISAIPPVPEIKNATRTPILVETYSDIIRHICKSQDCSFIDPFSFMRHTRFGLSKNDMHADNIHLRSYEELAQNLIKLV